MLLFGGIGCVLGALWFTVTLLGLVAMSDLFVKIGILPAMAEGIRQTSELGIPPET